MARPTDPLEFLSPKESQGVGQAVAEAERGTSAEIKEMLVRHCWGDLRDKAERLFHKHKLDRTAQHNCVLVLLVIANHEFVIYGDSGIHSRVGEGFWVDVRDAMGACFRDDRFGDGLCEGVRLIGQKLSEHFPIQADDRNEIPDGVAHDE